MNIVLTSRELQILKLSSEQKPSDVIVMEIKVQKKEVEVNQKSAYKKFITTDPLAAMQKLLRSEFEVPD